MKLLLIIPLVLFCASSFAQTTSWTGYLADKMCSERLIASAEKAAAHSKECLTEEHCAKTGYGVIVDGKWYKFDKQGNELAAALLSSTKKERNFRVTVSGTMKKKKINVTNLAEAD